MAQPDKELAPATPKAAALLPADADAVEITAEQFRESFGEDLQRTLDMNTWLPGDLSQEYSRMEREVREALELENHDRRQIREIVFPQLGTAPRAPKGAGVYGPVDVQTIAAIHRGLLFNGGVEACDGTHVVHDTLPLTIHQIGISLVSYRGDQGTWCQRLFRRDLRVRSGDPITELSELLAKRARRGGLNQPNRRDALSEMARRAIMSYAERAILLEKSDATWRMGHGNPIPYELITGGGSLDLMVQATRTLRELIEGHQKIVYVASEPRELLLLTIGNALRPREYAIVGALSERLEEWIRQLRFKVGIATALGWDGESVTPAEWIPRFIDRVASKVVVGVYRATELAPCASLLCA